MSDHDPFAPLAMTPEERAALPPTKKTGFQQAPRNSKSLDQNLFDRIDLGLPEDGAGIKKKPKKVSHKERSVKYVVKLGYTSNWLEKWVTLKSGYSCTVDYLGLWDMEGTKPGRPRLLVQVCGSKKDADAHLRTMTSDKKALDNYKPRIDNLRMCIEQGWTLAILYWTKNEKGHYDPTVVKITTALVDEVVSRKRKPKAK